MQTDDLITLAHQLGWKDTQIMVFSQDMGVSGRTRIEERKGLSALIEKIQAGEIKAVLISDENRLFRDTTGIQVNSFIRLCQEQNVCLITPEQSYDFTKPIDVTRFRWQCGEHFPFDEAL